MAPERMREGQLGPGGLRRGEFGGGGQTDPIVADANRKQPLFRESFRRHPEIGGIIEVHEGVRPIRESRPNFAFLEQMLARQLGGKPEDHAERALGVWATLHGTTMLLLNKSIPRVFEFAIMRMLARRQEDRYQNASELLNDLAPLAGAHDVKV